MRIITGEGKYVRKYISLQTSNNLKDIIILPEKNLDINEQSKILLKNLKEGFIGDIITFSPFIICDAPTDTVYIVNKNLKLIQNNSHKFGNSADLTTMLILNRKFSCGDLTLEKINEIREDIIDLKNSNNFKDVFNKLNLLGDSFEKTNLVSLIKALDK